MSLPWTHEGRITASRPASLGPGRRGPRWLDDVGTVSRRDVGLSDAVRNGRGYEQATEEQRRLPNRRLASAACTPSGVEAAVSGRPICQAGTARSPSPTAMSASFLKGVFGTSAARTPRGPRLDFLKL